MIGRALRRAKAVFSKGDTGMDDISGERTRQAFGSAAPPVTATQPLDPIHVKVVLRSATGPWSLRRSSRTNIHAAPSTINASAYQDAA